MRRATTQLSQIARHNLNRPTIPSKDGQRHCLAYVLTLLRQTSGHAVEYFGVSYNTPIAEDKLAVSIIDRALLC